MNEIPTRQLNLAIQQATYLRNKILNSLPSIPTWRDLERDFGIELQPLVLPGKTLTEAFLNSKPEAFLVGRLMDSYIRDTPARLQRAAAQAEENGRRKVVRRLSPPDQCYRFANKPDLGLYPEQDPVFRDLYDILFCGKKLEPHQPNPRALLQNGIMGSGKTVVACAMIDRFIAEGRHKPADIMFPIMFPIIWLTVGNARIQTERSLIDVGLGSYLGTVIHVLSYDDLSTQAGQRRFCKILREPDPFNPEIEVVSYRWEPASTPLFLILDEAHSVQNADSQRTKIIQACDETERKLINPLTQKPIFGMRVLMLTATPVERVSDARMFVCMTDLIYQGQKITYETFNTSFANVIANGNPDKVSSEATHSLFNVLKHRVIELPRCRWDHKAINSVRLYNFQSQESRAHYDGSWDRHVKRCEALGKDPEAGAEYTSLQIFAREVEPIRVENILPEMIENVEAGRTSVMATRFTGTIIKAIFLLMDRYGYSRDKFSVVWGGRKNIKPERMLSQDDLQEIMMTYSQLETGLPPEIKRLIKNNLAWQEDRLLFGDESDGAQDERYDRLKSLGLIGVQGKPRRQAEIDKFQSGISRFMFFTAQSGGTGLSLHHMSADTAQRWLWATPIYSGKEFSQMMGRCPRRPSWSDSIQFVCLMNGTVESEHVAPILDRKLQAAGEFTSQRTDLAMVLAKKKVRNTRFDEADKLNSILRTQEQVLADADNEDSQLYNPDSGAEEEDDD